VDIRGSREREGAYETWSKVNGEESFYRFPAFSIPACFFAEKLGTHSVLSIVRHALRAAAVSTPLSSIRGGVSPTYESGDKVTLRNCFPQADEGELSPARAASLRFILPSVY